MIKMEETVVEEGNKVDDINELVKPVSRGEVWGYYLLLIALTPGEFMSALLLPALIEIQARLVAVGEDFITPCQVQIHQECFVIFGNYSISTSSLAFYAAAICSFLQAVILIPLSGLADLNNYRHYIILISVLCGGLSFILIFAVGDNYYISGILMILGGFFNASMVASTLALIPVYVKLNTDYVIATGIKSTKEVASVDQLSNIGGILSFAASGLVGLLGWGLKYLLSDNTMGYKAGINMVGLVWLLFGLIGWKLLVHRPGNQLPSNVSPISYSLRCVWDTIRLTIKLSNVTKIQLGFFFFSQGTNISGLLFIFVASKELNVPFSTMFIYTIISPSACSIGILILDQLQKYFKIPTIPTIFVTSLGVATAMTPIVIGYYHPTFGLKSSFQVGLSFLVTSFFYGPTLILTRSLLSTLIPPGREQQLFTINTLLNTATLWCGTLLISYLTDLTHTLRLAGYVPPTLMLIGAIVVSTINLEKGREQASKFQIT